MPESIDNLTRAIASGDSEAFARFFDQYCAMVQKETARVLNTDEATRLDIVQNVFHRFVRSGKRFSSEAQLVRWLQLAVRSCAYDHLRSELRHRRMKDSHVAETKARGACSHPEPDEHQARLDWLRTEIANLKQDEQNLLTMRHRFGWTLKQIADTIQSTPGAVDGRLKRLLDRLRKQAKERTDVAPESD